MGVFFCHEMVKSSKNSAQECLSECYGEVLKFCYFLVGFPLVLDYWGKLGKVEVILNQRLLEGGAGRSSPALLRSSSWASNSTTSFSTSSFTVSILYRCWRADGNWQKVSSFLDQPPR